MHEIQFRTLTALRDGGHLPFEAGRLERALRELDAAVAEVAEQYRERLAPAISRVWGDGIEAIRLDLREWLRRTAEAPGGWTPHRFELAFGLPEHLRPTADAASVATPVTVLDGAQLRGSIDVVERRADGTLRVTDNKSGKARVPDGAVIFGGRALQPVLYALAAEALLASPVDSGRLYYCTAVGEFTERRMVLDGVSRAHAQRALGIVGRAIEQGFLPAAPAPDECNFCDYREVCGPHEALRTARKPATRLTDLKTLRELP